MSGCEANVDEAWKRTTDLSEKPGHKPKGPPWTAARTTAEDSDRVFSLHPDGRRSLAERPDVDGKRDRWRLKTRSMKAEDRIDRGGGCVGSRQQTRRMTRDGDLDDDGRALIESHRSGSMKTPEKVDGSRGPS